jgi:NAD(P)-dependent dehydrogenase (short-subunit alcohol dehydrogenase family)
VIGKLDGKIALITGGGSGIGRATALIFAREGAKVVICDINVAGGNETVRLVEKNHGECTFIKADVTKAAEVEALVNKTVEIYGRLDCAYNNAGIITGRDGTVGMTEEDFDRDIAVDLKGVWLSMKYEIPQMLKQGKGAIVNTSSIAGLTGGAIGAMYNPSYHAAKHGVIGLTRVAAMEFARQGIRVNAVCPGFIDTPLTKPADEKDAVDQAQYTLAVEPIGRKGTAEEVGEAVVWLCSDAASFVTGHPMAVDGAWSAY